MFLKKVGLKLDRSFKILTSSGFPRAAAVQEQSFFRKSAGKTSADILVSRTMKGMVGGWLLSEVCRRSTAPLVSTFCSSVGYKLTEADCLKAQRSSVAPTG